MKAAIKFYLLLLILYLAMTGIAYLATGFSDPGIGFNELVITLTGSFIITSVVYYVFYTGQMKKGKKAILYTLMAIGIKFLLYLALLGIFAIFYKNLSIPFLVSFFVIYLVNTLYLLITFVSQLKSIKQTAPDGYEKKL